MATVPAPVFHDKLFTLEIALDAQRMHPFFALLARQCLGENFTVQGIQLEIIRRRNQRCVIRYRVEVQDGQGRSRTWRVIGKVFKANRGERVHRLMQQLWQHGFARHAEDKISIPEPLYFSSELCMLFQEEVPGLPLKTLVKLVHQQEHFRQLARTAAKLHGCPLVLDEPFLVRDHLLRCHPRYPFLQMACPELQPAIDHIVTTAEKIEAHLIAQAKLTPIHGDFHLGQVHIENDHAWLVDFDALSYGDPASDLGNLLVFLKGKAKKNPAMLDLIQAFFDEYFFHVDEEIAKRIPLYEALTHLRRACKALRLQEQGWRRRVQRMIDQGVACIALMEKNTEAIVRQLAAGEASDDEFEEAEFAEAE